MSREIKFRLVKGGKIVGYERHVLKRQCGDERPNVVCIEHSRTGTEYDRNVEKSGWWCIWFNKNYFIDHDRKDQFTGLLDKNGKELDWWEGDIVKKDNGHLAEIIFCDGCFLGKWIFWDDLPMFHFNNKGQRPKWFEKVGNIHEHPDLMEKTK